MLHSLVSCPPCPTFELVVGSLLNYSWPFLIGFVQVVDGEGMPNWEATGHGDLFVEYNVVLPQELSPQTKKSTCTGSFYEPSPDLSS